MNYSVIISFFLILPLISACGMSYEKELKSFKVIAAEVDCEQANIHLKILEADNPTMIGSPILPVCVNDSFCMKEFYNLQDTSAKYSIRGYVSFEGHDVFDYGCLDAKAIKIERFERIFD